MPKIYLSENGSLSQKLLRHEVQKINLQLLNRSFAIMSSGLIKQTSKS